MTPDFSAPPDTVPLHNPTIRRVISSILLANSDRSVLVRNPIADRLPGLMVFCIDERAIADMLPTLFEASDSLDQIPRRDPLELSIDEDLIAVFTWMETTGLSWFKLSLELIGMRVLVYAFIGNEVCRQLAPKLTELGAPVNFAQKGEGQ